MEKRTRHGGREGGKRDREWRMRQTDVEWRTRRRAALLFISRRKTTKQRNKQREVKSSFPMVYMCFKGLVGSWGISQHALGTRQGNILVSN